MSQRMSGRAGRALACAGPQGLPDLELLQALQQDMLAQDVAADQLALVAQLQGQTLQALPV